MKELKIDVTGSKGELNIRTGELTDPYLYKEESIVGSISAPCDFFTHKYLKAESQDFPFERMLVSFSLSQGTIVYEENTATNEGGKKIKGVLSFDEDLKALGVNDSKRAYTPTELSKELKMLKYMFASTEEWMKTVTDLKNFTAEFTSVLDKKDDNNGNSLDSRITKLSTSFNLSFNLLSNVYIGLKDKKTFEVNIIIDARSSNVSFYLESVELREIEKTIKDEVINKELYSFKIHVPVIELL